ncbi:hypothetical protein pb186bvf_013486 [Paramecium bursaria]
MSKPPRESQKIGNFNTFQLPSDHVETVQNRVRSQYVKLFRNAFIFGFFIEIVIIKTRIYQNLIRSTTQKRLESKLKEDESLRQKKELNEKN